jgi:hypothetical protein
MGFWKTILGIARRRFIGPPIIVLALALAGLAYGLAPTHYVSSGYMVLTTPTAGGVVDKSKPSWQTNPLLQFNDGLKTTAAILIQSMNTPEVLAGLGAPPGAGIKITINDGSTNPDLLGTSTTGPFIYVEVDGQSPVGVRDIVANAEQKIRDDLANRQRELKAPRSTYISLTDVVTPTDPVTKNTSKWKAAGVGLFLSLFLGFGIAYAVERRRVGRRRAVLPYAETDRRIPRVAIDPPDHYGYASVAESYSITASRAESSKPDEGAPSDPPREEEETREFQIIFDEVQEKPSTGEQRARPFTVLRDSSDDRQAGPPGKNDAGGHSDDVAAPRAG